MPNTKGPIVVLGNFDGVHLGHRALLKRAVSLAAEAATTVVVRTFDTLPERAITPLAERKRLLLHYGADAVVFDSFAAIKDFSPRQFVLDILYSELHAEAVVCGYNYTFGHKGSGNAALLADLCKELGIACHTVDRVTCEGEEISSTRIRALLSEGKIEEATTLLGHPYALCGTVVHGNALGRTLGLPTINFDTDKTLLLPKRGVYAALCRLPDHRAVPAVTNVGCRPTVTNEEKTVIETHLLDCSEDLYGASLRVELLSFLREERRFPSLDALQAAIADDCRHALALLTHNPSSEI